MGMAVTTRSQGEARTEPSPEPSEKEPTPLMCLFQAASLQNGETTPSCCLKPLGFGTLTFSPRGVTYESNWELTWQPQEMNTTYMGRPHSQVWNGLVGLLLRPLGQAVMMGRKLSLLFQPHPNAYDSELPTTWAMLWEGFVLSRFSDICTCLFLFWDLELQGTDLLPINITALTIFEGAHSLCPKSSPLLRILGI